MEVRLGRGQQSSTMAEPPRDIAPEVLTGTVAERAEIHAQELLTVVKELGMTGRKIPHKKGPIIVLSPQPEQAITQPLTVAPRPRQISEFRPPTPYQRRIELKEIAIAINGPVQHTFPDGARVTIQPKPTR